MNTSAYALMAILLLAASASAMEADLGDDNTIALKPCPQGYELVKKDIDGDGDLEEVCEDTTGSVGWDAVNETVNGGGNKVANAVFKGDQDACFTCQVGGIGRDGTIWITIRVVPDGTADYALHKVNGGRDPVHVGDDVWLVHFPAGKNHGHLVIDAVATAAAQESRFTLEILPDSKAADPAEAAYVPRAASSHLILGYDHAQDAWTTSINPALI